MKKKISIALLLISSSALAATSGLNPSSVKITIYGVAVSPNTNCSNATVVATYPTGQQFDFMQTPTPTLFTGSLAAGTYKCVILQMSDVIQFVPAVTSDNRYCVAGTTYTRDVCRASQGTFQPVTMNADKTVTIGSSTPCTGTQAAPSNDMPGLFLSTASTNVSGGSSFLQPTVSTNGINLGAALVITASTSGTFVVNFNGQVNESGSSCDVGPPIFSFR